MVNSLKELTKKVILPIGTSGSGKSTWANSLPSNRYSIISLDEMRIEFTGDINDKSKDEEIYQKVKGMTIDIIKTGKDVIIDTTNLQKERRRDFINAVKELVPDICFEYKLLPLNPKLAKKRINKQIERGENRANVSDSTIDRHAILYEQMLNDINEEPLSEFKEN